MSTSGSVFSETLQEITNTKLEELQKRRDAYEAEKTALLASIENNKNPVQRLTALSIGVKKCLKIHTDRSGRVAFEGNDWDKQRLVETELYNLDRFLGQAVHDPSLSANTLKKWEDSLLGHLEAQSRKFTYASLYGKLVTEWLSSERPNVGSTSEDVEMGEDFETIDSAKKLQSRIEWEKMVFEPAPLDLDKLMAYLDNLFGVGDPERKPLFKVLVQLRERVMEFERNFRNVKQFTPGSLRLTIQGLVRSDLLTDEKRQVLNDFANNDIILNEVADVLNMRAATLGTWSWGPGVPLEQRRKITGVFSIHMHEDLLQAIFLQYIGTILSVFFADAFSQFRKSPDAWISSRQDIPSAEKNKLEYYLGPLDTEDCLQVLRRREYRQNYFVSHLVRSMRQPVESAEGDEEADYAHGPGSRNLQTQPNAAPPPMQMMAAQQQQAHSVQRQLARQAQIAQQPGGLFGHASSFSGTVPASRKLKRRIMEPMSDEATDENSETEDEHEIRARNPMATKKRLLHLLSAEMTISTALQGEFTAFHSVFNSLYSLFPHATIETIMALFGFSDTWRGFFRAFLKAPLRFLDDDASTPARTRRRGTAGSHVLSEVFGEVTLFVLDFAVNQATSGNMLWRLHDDFWFWSPDHQLCVKAWKAVTEFLDATGTSLDPAKTGTARIVKNNAKDNSTTTAAAPDLDPSLPRGDIRWGFLRLSPEQGHFVIDQQMVDGHIAELRRQLADKSKSIFNFIQTWNVYVATFFTSNFGKPANCFGRDHVDEMLRTYARIQREIFSPTTTSTDTSGPSSLSLDASTAAAPPSNIVDYLKTLLSSRFAIPEPIPDGYLFFPVDLGGLDLRSPFISLLQIRDSILQSTTPLINQLHESERDAYARAKKRFDSGAVARQRGDGFGSKWPRGEATTFLTFEEFIRHRDQRVLGTTGVHVADIYRRLLQEPTPESIRPSSTTGDGMLASLSGQGGLGSIHGNWESMDPYWRWVASMYGPEVLEMFDGLNIVDPGLLPMGMVRLLREKRVKWGS